MPEPKQPRYTTNNRILNNLSDEDYERLRPHLTLVNLNLGEIIYQPNQSIKHIYFPDNSMASVIATTPEGQSAEVGVIGREGIVGVDVLMGVDSTSNQVLIQLADGALRMNAATAKKEFAESASMNAALLLCIHALMMQISQTALCNRLHTIEQRLARWLLLCHDRSASDVLTLTQEFLAIMLGANRPSVTTAALILQGGGFIKYSRGRITVTDREGLEDFACDCYRVTKPEYDRLPK